MIASTMNTPLTPPTKLPSHLREFDDMRTARSWLYEGTAKAMKSAFPVEDDNWRLELADVELQPKEFGLRKQKDALMSNAQLRVPVQGTWRLWDKQNNVLVSERRGTVMNLPYLTDRGTVVYNGNEYSSVSQSRLKPGAYTRVRRSGEPETMFNVAPRSGRTFRLYMEPESGVFKLDVGGSSIPAYPLLRAAGLADKEIQDQLGAELTATNIAAADRTALSRTYQRLAGRMAQTGLSEEQQRAQIRQLLEQSTVDPEVMRRTTGIEAGTLNGRVLLRAMQKMRNVLRGDEDPDDRDAPRYSSVLSIEDVLPERISLDAGRVAKNLLMLVKRKKDLAKLPPNPLSAYASQWLHNSRLAMPLEEANVLSLLEQMNRITKLGEGGISSAESITDEARDVNPGQVGFIDLVSGPEGTNIGIDVRTAFKTYKGRDRQIYAEFRDPRSGQLVYKKPEDLDGVRIAFPGELKNKKPTSRVLQDGKLLDVPNDDVDLEIPSFGHMSHAFANLNPMPTGYQSARAFYGSKFWGQYLPQAKGEVPLVESLLPDSDQTFGEYYGRKLGALAAPATGTVEQVTDDDLIIKDEKGKRHTIELVTHLPFNRMSAISYDTLLKPGDTVTAGDPVAHSNFTDPKTYGLTMGQNLRVAVVPFRGHSYEDAQIISESAARKLATNRLYGFEAEEKHGTQLDKNTYVSLFAKRFTDEQLRSMDAKGVVKPGTRLREGDPILLATGPKLLSAEDSYLGRLHKTLKNARSDKSEVWEHDYEGIVTDVRHTRSGARVFVKADVPVKAGDKLSTRYGLKGTVGRVVPDDEMPRDPSTNLPYEFLMNPMGIQSRVAPNQLLELQLARIARMTGKQMRLPQEPPEGGWRAWVRAQMKEHDLEAKVPVFDPKLGRTLDKPVHAGEAYIMAFHHLSDKKESARGSAGLSYTHEEEPAKGQGATRSAKRLSSMDLNALLAHGATHVIDDALLVRGARNADYFRALRAGRTLPPVKVPMIYDKMLNTLRASGIQVRKKDSLLELMPMTDKDVERLSAGVVTKSDRVDRNFKPVKGGLFDPGLTGGGLVGHRWTHIELPEPLPNPVFEEPIRRLLGLRQQDLEDIIAHRQQLGGQTGGAAIKQALGSLDVGAEINKHRKLIQTRRGQARDNSIKALGFLSTLQRQGLSPADWVVTKVPVLPPNLRPLSRMGDVTLEADLNELYRDLIETGNGVRDLRGSVDEATMADDYQTMYNAYKAVAGLGDPITPEGRAKGLKGAFRQVIGNSPKTGMVQSKVLSKNVDLVGRGVVSPDANLDMDTIGIPEGSAWSLYRDFAMRRLVRQNIPMERAMEMVDTRHPAALKAVLAEMETRPVIVDRAPTWHKFNFMAFRPVMVPGHVIRTPPLINKSFTLDHDGDQMNFHVPATDEAAAEAWEKMRPSRNLISLTDLRSPRYGAEQEFALGLYQMTRDPTNKAPVVFNSLREARQAYQRKELDLNDPIIIRGVTA